MYHAVCVVSASDKIDMPDTLGHAVGPERFELLAKVAGNEVSHWLKLESSIRI